tara:strand:- start:838 stop:1056 length:219 start_codon:yes stop_codon:yes gene_type:complete
MEYPMLMSIACGERRFVGFYDGPDNSILYGVYVNGTEDYPVWLDEEEAKFIITRNHNITTFDQSLEMARMGK